MENSLKEARIRLIPGMELFSKKTINTSAEALELIINEFKDCDRENLIVMNFNEQANAINYVVVAVGGPDFVTFDIPTIFKAALLSHSTAFIAMHNHPYMSTEPSDGDIAVTKRMEEAGKIMGIPLLDHVIFNDKGEAYSIKKQKIIREKD